MMIKDKSAPSVPTDGSVDYKKIKKNKQTSQLLTDVKTRGARRLSNSMINGFQHTQVILREVETNDRSAPKILEITPLHRNPRPAVMSELRKRSESKDLGLKHTPTEKVRDRSLPNIDVNIKVETKSKKKKKLLADVKAVGARNLANKEIKGFEHTNIVLKEVETNDRSTPSVEAKEITPLKKNPRPAVLEEIRRRSVSSDGCMMNTLSPTPEKRDRSEPCKEIMCEDINGAKRSTPRRELLVDIKVKANRKLSNAAIKGFEGVPVLREVDGHNMADKSAPAIDLNKRNGVSSSAQDSKRSTTKRVDNDEPKKADQSNAKAAGILAAIVLILTCAACFTKKESSSSTRTKRSDIL